ncbi:MAG: ATP-binding protein, partial [Saprospiraceae bacterium]|nr:ATP-binding protein [Saprospiraceae bacterium]
MTENILGRRMEDIDIAFLTAFFKEERIESDTLELKSFGEHEKDAKDFKSKQNDVLKAICAFLNSSGGVIIWGAPIGKMKGSDKSKVFKGDLSPVDREIEKDSFISSLSDKTIPLPNNIKFWPLKIADGKFVYVIEVMESLTKPHQFDNRYYMRLDGQTRTAPHHYIEALFKQVRFPRIEGFIKINKRSEHITNRLIGNNSSPVSYIYLNLTLTIWNFSPFQNEENISFVLRCRDGAIQVQPTPNYVFENRVTKNVLRGNEVAPILYFGSPYSKDIKIRYSKDLITGINGIVDIEFVFCGKLSPQKFSFYKLDLFKQVEEHKMNELLVEYRENKSHYEVQLEQGQNRESFLK